MIESGLLVGRRYSQWQKKEVKTIIVNSRSKLASQRTIAGALEHANSYDRIELVGGEYNETVNISFPIEIVGSEGEDIVISTRGTTITISNSTPVYFADLTITSRGKLEEEASVVVTDGTPTFFRCKISSVLITGHGNPKFSSCIINNSTNGIGLKCTGEGGGTITDCTISYHSMLCMSISSLGQLLVEGCTIIQQPFSSTAIRVSYSRLKPDQKWNEKIPCKDVLFSRNKIYFSLSENANIPPRRNDQNIQPVLNSLGLPCCVMVQQFAHPSFVENELLEGEIGFCFDLGGSANLTGNLIRNQHICGLLIYVELRAMNASPIDKTNGFSSAEKSFNGLKNDQEATTQQLLYGQAAECDGVSGNEGEQIRKISGDPNETGYGPLLITGGNIFDSCHIGIDVRMQDHDIDGMVTPSVNNVPAKTSHLSKEGTQIPSSSQGGDVSFETGNTSAASRGPEGRLQVSTVPRSSGFTTRLHRWINPKPQSTILPAESSKNIYREFLNLIGEEAPEARLKFIYEANESDAGTNPNSNSNPSKGILGQGGKNPHAAIASNRHWGLYNDSSPLNNLSIPLPDFGEKVEFHEIENDLRDLAHDIFAAFGSQMPLPPAEVRGMTRDLLDGQVGSGADAASAYGESEAADNSEGYREGKRLGESSNPGGLQSGRGVFKTAGLAAFLARYVLGMGGSSSFNKNSSSQSEAEYRIMSRMGGRGLEIESTHFFRCEHCAIRFSKGSYGMVHHCHFESSDEAAIRVEGGAYPMIALSVFTQNNVACIALSTFANPLICCNIFYRNNGSSILVHFLGRGLVVGNTFVKNDGFAVLEATDGASPIFYGNEIRDNNSCGIFLQEGNHALCLRNMLQANKRMQILVDGPSSSFIYGNILVGGAEVAIYLTRCAGGIITYNYIAHHIGNGITIDLDADPYVIENAIVQNCSIGILIRNNGAGTIVSNILSGNQQFNLLLAEGAITTVRGNRITAGLLGGISIQDEGVGQIEKNHILKNTRRNILVCGEQTQPVIRSNVIADAVSGVGMECKVHCHGIVYSNLFRCNSYCGLLLHNHSDLYFKSNYFINENVAVYATWRCDGVFADNLIRGSVQYGLAIDRGAQLFCTNNDIGDGQSVGINVLQSGKSVVANNVIHHNRIGIQFGRNLPEAIRNYSAFEADDSAVILLTASKVFDNTDTKLPLEQSNTLSAHRHRPRFNHDDLYELLRWDRPTPPPLPPDVLSDSVVYSNKVINNSCAGVLLGEGATGCFLSNVVSQNGFYGILADITYIKRQKAMGSEKLNIDNGIHQASRINKPHKRVGKLGPQQLPVLSRLDQFSKSSPERDKTEDECVGSVGRENAQFLTESTAIFRRNILKHHPIASIAFLSHFENSFVFEENTILFSPIGVLVTSHSYLHQFRSNYVHHCGEGVVFQDYGSGSIIGNHIVSCRYAGISVLYGSNPKIDDQNIIQQCLIGVFFDNGSLGILRNSRISYCHIGVIAVCGASPMGVKEGLTSSNFIASADGNTRGFTSNSLMYSMNSGFTGMTSSFHGSVGVSPAKYNTSSPSKLGAIGSRPFENDITFVPLSSLSSLCIVEENHILQNALHGVVILWDRGGKVLRHSSMPSIMPSFLVSFSLMSLEDLEKNFSEEYSLPSTLSNAFLEAQQGEWELLHQRLVVSTEISKDSFIMYKKYAEMLGGSPQFLRNEVHENRFGGFVALTTNLKSLPDKKDREGLESEENLLADNNKKSVDHQFHMGFDDVPTENITKSPSKKAGKGKNVSEKSASASSKKHPFISATSKNIETQSKHPTSVSNEVEGEGITSSGDELIQLLYKMSSPIPKSRRLHVRLSGNNCTSNCIGILIDQDFHCRCDGDHFDKNGLWGGFFRPFSVPMMKESHFSRNGFCGIYAACAVSGFLNTCHIEDNNRLGGGLGDLEAMSHDAVVQLLDSLDQRFRQMSRDLSFLLPKMREPIAKPSFLNDDELGTSLSSVVTPSSTPPFNENAMDSMELFQLFQKIEPLLTSYLPMHTVFANHRAVLAKTVHEIRVVASSVSDTNTYAPFSLPNIQTEQLFSGRQVGIGALSVAPTLHISSKEEVNDKSTKSTLFPSTGDSNQKASIHDLRANMEPGAKNSSKSIGFQEYDKHLNRIVETISPILSSPSFGGIGLWTEDGCQLVIEHSELSGHEHAAVLYTTSLLEQYEIIAAREGMNDKFTSLTSSEGSPNRINKDNPIRRAEVIDSLISASYSNLEVNVRRASSLFSVFSQETLCTPEGIVPDTLLQGGGTRAEKWTCGKFNEILRRQRLRGTTLPSFSIRHSHIFRNHRYGLVFHLSHIVMGETTMLSPTEYYAKESHLSAQSSNPLKDEKAPSSATPRNLGRSSSPVNQNKGLPLLEVNMVNTNSPSSAPYAWFSSINLYDEPSVHLTDNLLEGNGIVGILFEIISIIELKDIRNRIQLAEIYEQQLQHCSKLNSNSMGNDLHGVLSTNDVSSVAGMGLDTRNLKTRIVFTTQGTYTSSKELNEPSGTKRSKKGSTVMGSHAAVSSTRKGNGENTAEKNYALSHDERFEYADWDNHIRFARLAQNTFEHHGGCGVFARARHILRTSDGMRILLNVDTVNMSNNQYNNSYRLMNTPLFQSATSVRPAGMLELIQNKFRKFPVGMIFVGQLGSKTVSVRENMINDMLCGILLKGNSVFTTLGPHNEFHENDIGIMVIDDGPPKSNLGFSLTNSASESVAKPDAQFFWTGISAHCSDFSCITNNIFSKTHSASIAIRVKSPSHVYPGVVVLRNIFKNHEVKSVGLAIFSPLRVIQNEFYSNICSVLIQGNENAIFFPDITTEDKRAVLTENVFKNNAVGVFILDRTSPKFFKNVFLYHTRCGIEFIGEGSYPLLENCLFKSNMSSKEDSSEALVINPYEPLSICGIPISLLPLVSCTQPMGFGVITSSSSHGIIRSTCFLENDIGLYLNRRATEDKSNGATQTLSIERCIFLNHTLTGILIEDIEHLVQLGIENLEKTRLSKMPSTLSTNKIKEENYIGTKESLLRNSGALQASICEQLKLLTLQKNDNVSLPSPDGSFHLTIKKCLFRANGNSAKASLAQTSETLSESNASGKESEDNSTSLKLNPDDLASDTSPIPLKKASQVRDSLQKNATDIDFFGNIAITPHADLIIQHKGHVLVEQCIFYGTVHGFQYGLGVFSQNYFCGNIVDEGAVAHPFSYSQFLKNIFIDKKQAILTCSNSFSLFTKNFMASNKVAILSLGFSRSRFVENQIAMGKTALIIAYGGFFSNNDLSASPVGVIIREPEASGKEYYYTGTPGAGISGAKAISTNSAGLTDGNAVSSQKGSSVNPTALILNMGNELVLVDNKIYSCETEGVLVAGGVDMRGNDIFNSKINVHLTYTTSNALEGRLCALEGNNIYDGGVGVVCGPDSTGLLSRNDIFDNTIAAVRLEKNTTCILEGNNIYAEGSNEAVMEMPDSKGQVRNNNIRKQFSPFFRKTHTPQRRKEVAEQAALFASRLKSHRAFVDSECEKINLLEDSLSQLIGQLENMFRQQCLSPDFSTGFSTLVSSPSQGKVRGNLKQGFEGYNLDSKGGKTNLLTTSESVANDSAYSGLRPPLGSRRQSSRKRASSKVNGAASSTDSLAPSRKNLSISQKEGGNSTTHNFSEERDAILVDYTSNQDSGESPLPTIKQRSVETPVCLLVFGFHPSQKETIVTLVMDQFNDLPNALITGIDFQLHVATSLTEVTLIANTYSPSIAVILFNPDGHSSDSENPLSLFQNAIQTLEGRSRLSYIYIITKSDATILCDGKSFTKELIEDSFLSKGNSSVDTHNYRFFYAENDDWDKTIKQLQLDLKSKINPRDDFASEGFSILSKANPLYDSTSQKKTLLVNADTSISSEGKRLLNPIMNEYLPSLDQNSTYSQSLQNSMESADIQREDTLLPLISSSKSSNFNRGTGRMFSSEPSSSSLGPMLAGSNLLSGNSSSTKLSDENNSSGLKITNTDIIEQQNMKLGKKEKRGKEKSFRKTTKTKSSNIADSSINKKKKPDKPKNKK